MSDRPLPRSTVEYLDRGAPEGRRNAELFAAACQMRDAGFSSGEGVSMLTDRAVRDGLGEREAAATINSAWGAPARDPIRRGFKVRGLSYERGPDRQAERPMLSALKQSRSVRYELTTSFDWKLPPALPDGARQLLKTAFKPGEHVELVLATTGEDGKEIPDGKGPALALEDWLTRLERANGDPNKFLSNGARNGIYICINPLKEERRDDQVSAFRHVLVEFDSIPLEHQLQLITKSNLPITAVVSSGGRSLHAWVRVDAKDRKEYDERVKSVFGHFADYEIDPQNKNPSRLCRLANCVRGDKRQELLALNIGAPTFEDWALSLELEDLGQQITIDELLGFNEENDPNCLIGKRWLCRGGSCLLIGQAGIGKSSIEMQLAILWGLGRAAFGLAPKKALKSVIVQAENDAGDLSEMFKGVCRALGILEDVASLNILRENLIIVRDTVHTGHDFARVAERLVSKHKPDLLWGDPLLSYVGDDIASQKVCSEFLRHWLNPISEKTGVCWMFLHHTTKPSADPKARQGWTSGDKSYLGMGSSELTNWARAVVTITQVDDGVFELGCRKRGKRADLRNGKGEIAPGNKIIVRHAEAGISWETFDEWTPPSKGGKIRGPAKIAKDWSAAAALITTPSKRIDVCKICAPALGLSAESLQFHTRYFSQLAEHLQKTEDGLYCYRAPQPTPPDASPSAPVAPETPSKFEF